MKALLILSLLISNFSTSINYKCPNKNIIVENTLKKVNNFDDKIKGYFNDDNLEDYIIWDKKKKDKVTLTVFINNSKSYLKKVTFDITNDDFENVENPLQNLFISNPKKGEILVGSSCCGNFKTTESCYYKFWLCFKIM